ncbi:MAG: UPF0179 family protein [Candidatus Bathyarchaeota archaeon]|nr:MAG: UPF0179 family protein [Candidatus Bathyarchaeota archaeon]
MDSEKTVITLVGITQAKKGFTFLHEGTTEGCDNCTLYDVCITNLNAGKIYKVIQIRDKIFPCKIHEDGVRIVEVAEAHIEVNIEKKIAFLNGTITFQPQTCEQFTCSNYSKCVPQGLHAQEKCKILAIQSEIMCPLNRQLVQVRLQQVEDWTLQKSQ